MNETSKLLEFLTVFTLVSIGKHQSLEDIWKGNDAPHHFVFVHHHQSVHLEETEKKNKHLNYSQLYSALWRKI